MDSDLFGAPVLNFDLLNDFGALGKSLEVTVYQVETFETKVMEVGGPIVECKPSGSCNKGLFCPV